MRLKVGRRDHTVVGSTGIYIICAFHPLGKVYSIKTLCDNTKELVT
jgi:hypothetical protein